MSTTYAAVQHAPQKISVDHIEGGRYVCQISFWFASRGAAKEELARLCAADGVPAFSKYVISMDDLS